MAPIDFTKLQYTNKLTDYTGGPCVIECFATWCPPCRAQIPHIAELTKKYPKVYIVSVSTEQPSDVKNLQSKIPKMAEYNVATDAAGEVQRLMEQNRVSGIPHCFIYNSAGKMVASCHPGEAESHIASLE